MSRPDRADLLKLDYGFNGKPFLRVRAGGSDAAEYGWDGKPFFPAPGAAVTPEPEPEPAIARPVLFVISQ
jgi:hypothetical protein